MVNDVHVFMNKFVNGSGTVHEPFVNSRECLRKFPQEFLGNPQGNPQGERDTHTYIIYVRARRVRSPKESPR